jgi:hypothetical protein
MLSKKIGVHAALLVALVGAGAAYSAIAPRQQLRGQDRVYGGGQFGPGCFSNSDVCFANPRNFAVDAHGTGNAARGNSTYGTPGIGDNYRSVRCLRVDGNMAVVGGIVIRGGSAGFGYVQYFVDRGGPGLGDRDLISPSLIDPLDAAGWPAGFPDVCPPVTEIPGGGAPMFRELDEGDLVVAEGSHH